MHANTLNPAHKAVFSVNEVMTALDLSRQEVYNQINAGKLRSFKVGRRRLIPCDAVPAWVQAMEAGGQA